MPGSFAYTVSVEFSDPTVAEEWLEWLKAGHLAEVLAGGAADAEVIELIVPPPRRRFEVRYHFADADAFAIYEREHAPRLRADGLARFPPERGVSYQRSTGQVLGRWPRGC